MLVRCEVLRSICENQVLLEYKVNHESEFSLVTMPRIGVRDEGLGTGGYVISLEARHGCCRD
jgi:hypothetical protein